MDQCSRSVYANRSACRIGCFHHVEYCLETASALDAVGGRVVVDVNKYVSRVPVRPSQRPASLRQWTSLVTYIEVVTALAGLVGSVRLGRIVGSTCVDAGTGALCMSKTVVAHARLGYVRVLVRNTSCRGLGPLATLT